MGNIDWWKTMVGEARVASVMVEPLMIYHRCLSMSKPRLEVFFDRILFELKVLLWKLLLNIFYEWEIMLVTFLGKCGCSP